MDIICSTPLKIRLNLVRLLSTFSFQVLNISNNRDFAASLGPCSNVWPPSAWRNFCLALLNTFFCYNLCPLPLVLLCISEKSLSPSSVWNTHLKQILDVSLKKVWQDTESPKLGEVCANKYQRIITSLDLLTMFLQMQHNMKLVFIAARTHYCIIFNFSTRTPRSFSAELLTGQLMPSQYCCMGLWCPKDVSSHLLLLNLVDGFLLVHFFQSFGIPLNGREGSQGANGVEPVHCCLWGCTGCLPPTIQAASDVKHEGLW